MLEKDSIYSMTMIQTMETGSNHNQRKKIVILCKSLSLKLKSEHVNSGPGGHSRFALRQWNLMGLGRWMRGVCVCVCVCPHTITVNKIPYFHQYTEGNQKDFVQAIE